MAISPIFNSFSKGEWDSKLDARADLEGYSQALRKLTNAVIMGSGGVEKRSGTKYIASVKTASAKTRLIPFYISKDIKYLLEFGNNYIRVYKNDVYLSYEITTTYTTSEIPDLRVIQVGSVMWIVHHNHKPASLTRLADNSWTLADIVFLDGPYRQLNNNPSLTLAAGASVGSTTLTASASLFTANDVGRLVRLEGVSTTVWGWAQITAFTSATQVSIDIKAAVKTGATTLWRLGAYYIGNYPSQIEVFENRLCLANTPLDPQRLDISEYDLFTGFKPSDLTSGSVLDACAINLELAGSVAIKINSIKAANYGLFVGTTAGEFIVRANNSGDSLTPNTANIRPNNTYKCSSYDAKSVENTIFYIQDDEERIRSVQYAYDKDALVSENINLFNTTISKPSVIQLEYQSYPNNFLWALRSDGVLLCLSTNTSSGILGWSKHLIGGESDSAGNQAKVESLAVLDDELYMIVQRYINSGVVRYIEKLSNFFDEETSRFDLSYVDSFVKYNTTLNISAITKANPCKITSTGHGLVNGDYVYLSDIYGMTELNGKKFKITKVDNDNFTLDGINSTAYTTYISGGYARKYVSVATGLNHLEGQEVVVYANGAKQTNQTVSGGQITLQYPAHSYSIGLKYSFYLTTMNNTTNSQIGTGQSKIKRINKITPRLYNSLGGEVGTVENKMDKMYFRDRASLMDTAPELFTGDYDITPNSDYDKWGRIYIKQEDPFPFIILGIIYKIEVTENS